MVDPQTGLFTRRPPGGEWYDEIALRLQSWLEEHRDRTSARLVVMHGMSSRVLRGLLTGAPHHPGCGAPVAAALPQGSVVELVDGRERTLDPAATAA
jgi:probable phosphoglycerate mutase